MSAAAAKDPTLFVTGGGTAGHIYAGISVADHWRERYPNAEILFVGAKGGMEERLVPRSSYPLKVLPMGAWNGMPWSKRLKTAFLIPWAFLRALGWLIQKRPAAVLGVGGYASFPVVLAAGVMGWIWGCRVAVLEQNVLPGLTNRVLGRFSARIFCAFPGSEEVFGSSKVLITGNPVRSSMKRLSSAPGSPFTLFIFGGSQGAVGINTLIIESLPFLRQSGLPIRFIHQTGERDYDRVSRAYRESGLEARVEKFIYDMMDAYSQADLLICRAGSSTLAEIAAVGRAALLIPLVSKDRHQVYNAKLFSDSGAAKMNLQNESSGQSVAQSILGLAGDLKQVRAMEQKITEFYKPDTVRQIVSDLTISLDK
jgi:UDP-N-acetylglucosamine--N-acetylmuramyl-(pentapeptide) pyrophosphoryl-undecaprenol N-acetylglucosamine transferase